MQDHFVSLLSRLPQISLGEMGSVRLMNRVDRKYLATFAQLEELLAKASREYMVQEINGKLYSEYETQYLDDRLHTMYLNHHNGRLTRQKVRVRHYVDTETYFFEVKRKNNHGRTSKKRMEVEGFEVSGNCSVAEFLKRHAILDLPLESLEPKVMNHFERITLVNKGRTERLTIDVDLEFHNRNTGMGRFMDNLVVIEVKRDGRAFSPIAGILRELRIHPSGFSKYCIGTAVTTPEIKKNLFLKKLRKIDKITSQV